MRLQCLTVRHVDIAQLLLLARENLLYHLALLLVAGLAAALEAEAPAAPVGGGDAASSGEGPPPVVAALRNGAYLARGYLEKAPERTLRGAGGGIVAHDEV